MFRTRAFWSVNADGSEHSDVMEFNERWSLVPLHNNHGTQLLSTSNARTKLVSAILMMALLPTEEAFRYEQVMVLTCPRLHFPFFAELG
jgi:hypothetical protein